MDSPTKLQANYLVAAPREGRVRRGHRPAPRVELLRAAAAAARTVLGRPQRRKLARAFRREHSYKWLKLAQLLGQLGVFLTLAAADVMPQSKGGYSVRSWGTKRISGWLKIYTFAHAFL